MLQNHPFSCCLGTTQSQAGGWMETYVSQLCYFPKSFGVIVRTGLQQPVDLELIHADI